MKGQISQFIEKHYKHFNSAALVDAAKGYESHLLQGGKMMITLAGAMSTAELGKSLAEMIRQDKVHIISCTGANLEEDLMNLVAHSHYKRVPEYRDLTPAQERELLDQGLNRVTDTCIPEEEAFRRLQDHVFDKWKSAETAGNCQRAVDVQDLRQRTRRWEQRAGRCDAAWHCSGHRVGATRAAVSPQGRNNASAGSEDGGTKETRPEEGQKEVPVG